MPTYFELLLSFWNWQTYPRLSTSPQKVSIWGLNIPKADQLKEGESIYARSLFENGSIPNFAGYFIKLRHLLARKCALIYLFQFQPRYFPVKVICMPLFFTTPTHTSHQTYHQMRPVLSSFIFKKNILNIKPMQAMKSTSFWVIYSLAEGIFRPIKPC